MDPLAILREFCVGGQLDQVALDGGVVRFGERYSFPKQSPTAFRARDGTGDFYTLEAVAFFIKAIVADANMGNYMKATMSTGTQQIEFRDRQPLRDYLTGKIDHTLHIADVVPTVTFYEPAAKKQRVEEGGEAAALQQLFEQEKQLRTRNTLLCAPGANFKPVLDVLDKVMAARKLLDAAKPAAPAAGAKQQRPAAAGPRPAGAPAAQQQQQKPAFMKPSGRMERQNIMGDLKAMGGDASVAASLGYGYGIQVEAAAGSGGGGGGSAAAAATAAAGGAPGGGRPSGGGDARASGSKHSHHSSSQHKHGHGGHAKHGSHKSSGGGSGLVGRSSAPPIILVPSGVTAMVNMFNARQLLEDGKFVRSDELMASNPAKPSSLEFKRTLLRSGPSFPRYVVTDKPPRAGHPDWKRVVAVIVQGKAWQFKGFPFKGADKGELVDTFSALFGAYFHYSDEAVPDTVSGWKVAKLPLRRTARHLDHTVMLDFYTKLDAFLAGRRCELDY